MPKCTLITHHVRNLKLLFTFFEGQAIWMKIFPWSPVDKLLLFIKEKNVTLASVHLATSLGT